MVKRLKISIVVHIFSLFCSFAVITVLLGLECRPTRSNDCLLACLFDLVQSLTRAWVLVRLAVSQSVLNIFKGTTEMLSHQHHNQWNTHHSFDTQSAAILQNQSIASSAGVGNQALLEQMRYEQGSQAARQSVLDTTAEHQRLKEERGIGTHYGDASNFSNMTDEETELSGSVCLNRRCGFLRMNYQIVLHRVGHGACPSVVSSHW